MLSMSVVFFCLTRPATSTVQGRVWRVWALRAGSVASEDVGYLEAGDGERAAAAGRARCGTTTGRLVRSRSGWLRRGEPDSMTPMCCRRNCSRMRRTTSSGDDLGEREEAEADGGQRRESAARRGGSRWGAGGRRCGSSCRRGRRRRGYGSSRAAARRRWRRRSITSTAASLPSPGAEGWGP
jgi:hypothetical protein